MDGKEISHPEAKSFEFNFDTTWSVTQGQKLGFLLGACRRPAGYQLPPTSLRDEWITPMRRLFGEARRAQTDASVANRNGEGALLDRNTFGGRITYETFAQILQR